MGDFINNRSRRLSFDSLLIFGRMAKNGKKKEKSEKKEVTEKKVMKEKERSAYTVMTTGMMRPMSFLVRSLNSLVNTAIATP